MHFLFLRTEINNLGTLLDAHTWPQPSRKHQAYNIISSILSSDLINLREMPGSWQKSSLLNSTFQETDKETEYKLYSNA